MIKSRKTAQLLVENVILRSQYCFRSIDYRPFKSVKLIREFITQNNALVQLNKIQSFDKQKLSISSLAQQQINQCKTINGLFRPYYKFSTQKQVISNVRLIDIKNDHVLVIKDRDSILSYLREVIVKLDPKSTQKCKQYRGVVLKIEQQLSYVGLYQHISPEDMDKLNLNDPVSKNSLTIQVKNLKQSVRDIQLPLYTNCIINASNQIQYLEQSTTPHIFNKIKIQPLAQVKNQSNQQPASFVHNEGRRKMQSSSIVLTACYDIHYGDMLIFQGGIGSGRTKQVQNLITCFLQPSLNNKFNNHIAIYVNLNKRDCQRIIKNLQKQHNCQNFIIFTQQKTTNTSSYIMSVKAVQTAKKLASLGYNVLIAVDGYKQLLVQEWSLLTNIKSSLLPISITNQLYSCSIDRQRVLSKQNNNIYRGSLTSIVVCQNSDMHVKSDIQNVQELSMYSNTIKHLLTLNSSIKFPLDFKTNHNNLSKRSQKRQNQQQQDRDLSKTLSLVLRKYINSLLIKKNDFQLKSRLNLTKDQPWQHYFVLDSKWWTTGIKKFKSESISQRDHFMLFVIWNIENEISSQWTITCIDAFRKYQQFIRQKSKYEADEQTNKEALQHIYSELFLNREIFDQFLNESKLNDLIEPFKKDYLA